MQIFFFKVICVGNLLEQGVAPDDLQRSLPSSVILWLWFRDCCSLWLAVQDTRAQERWVTRSTNLEVARLVKATGRSPVHMQKAVQDAVQVSKSFLASSCCPRVLFWIGQPCTDVLDTLRHLKRYHKPLFKQLSPPRSAFLKIIYKASVKAGTQAQISSHAIQHFDHWNVPSHWNVCIHMVVLVGFIFAFVILK